MIEPEMAFADLSDDMRVAEDMIKFVIAYVLENAPEEMAFFNQFVDKGLLDRLNHVMTSEFGHVTYTEAVKLLEQHNDKFDYKVFWGCDLQTEHKRYLNELGLKPEDYGFYLDLRKYGSTRHAGFGLGFERCVMYLTGISNIRDVLPFPRTVGNCEL